MSSTVDHMVAAAVDGGCTPELARELCNNVAAALDDAGGRRIGMVRRMIQHRQHHWLKWSRLVLDVGELARAIVRAYDEGSA